MKNITLAVVAVLIFIAGFLFWKNTSPVPNLIGEQKTVETAGMGGGEIAESRYVEFTQESFQKSANKRRVLFFYASWCPICRPADASFRESISLIPDDVILFRVNFNDPDTDVNEKDLAKKYRIAYQHTYVLVDSAGNVLKEWSGGEIEELLQNLK